MQILTSIAELRAWRKTAGHVALVPTMGNLHEGHITLCRTALAHTAPLGGQTIASIFVNPIQFGPNEDLDKYPRTFEADCEKLQAAGVHAVFHPSVDTMYPYGEQTYFVEPPELQNRLCGEFRPGHFRGVATVVTKLFNLVQPDTAVFGKKDYQQLKVLEGMVQQLNMPITILGQEIARAPDGLALSSRNGYLGAAERVEAPRLQQELQTIRSAIASGVRDYEALCAQARDRLAAHGWRTDYLLVANQRDLRPATPADRALAVLVASWLGTTRLIDNVEITLAA